MAKKIAAQVRSSAISLAEQIERLLERPAAIDDGPGLIDPIRRHRLFERAKRPIDAMATMIGIQAWSQGRRFCS